MIADMIGGAYAFWEARGLAFEARRRGERRAAGAAADPDAAGALAEIAGRVGDARIVSFDLFDTLLLRRGLALEGIQRKTAGYARLIAGRRAGEAIFAARHYLSGRIKARMIAAGAGDEPPLEVIFREALIGAGLSGAAAASAAASLVAFETEVEARGIRPAPGAAALLSGLRARGLVVIAVTDMYLRGPEVDAILRRAGLRDGFDEVFVSADLGWTKRGGKIFNAVAGRLGAAPEDILHIGDRLDSDVVPARDAGWRAIHFMDRAGVAETEAANIRESYAPTPTLRRRGVAAALDMADERALGSPERIVDQLIGPAAGILALRALGLARRTGAARLYHLTRDGTVIGEIAEAARGLRPHLAPEGLEIRELAISRALGARLQVRDARDLWKLANLAPYIAGAPFSAETLRRAFDLPEDALVGGARRAEGEALRRALDDPAVAAPLLRALDAGREAVEAYLEGAGLLEPAPSVAVDIGYSGTFAAQLSDLFFARPAPGRRVDFLFLMTSRYFNGNLRRVHPQIRIHPGVALDHRRRSARWATWNFAWVEPFLVDPERGRLVSLGPDGPVFAESPYGAGARAELGRLRAAIRERALRLVDDFHAAPGDLDEAAAVLQRRFERFAGRPAFSEARAVRGLAHQTGQVELALRAPTRRVNPLRLMAELQSMKKTDIWAQGSLKLSGLGLVNRIMADAPTADSRADTRAAQD
ncbi:HAD-IA family hydrolase [Pikeienuella sp. HZG-20]|uniref:HAD-IA family hydrolase n=1 Tax=Paludibacillus litoralis TaxID=3133267 RepID=UPI0030EB3047